MLKLEGCFKGFESNDIMFFIFMQKVLQVYLKPNLDRCKKKYEKSLYLVKD